MFPAFLLAYHTRDREQIPFRPMRSCVQVEHGEKTLADPWGRQVDAAGRPGSHGSGAAPNEADLETEEEREARIEIERRQARLVRALTTRESEDGNTTAAMAPSRFLALMANTLRYLPER
jgi:hypothetical protein